MIKTTLIFPTLLVLLGTIFMTQSAYAQDYYTNRQNQSDDEKNIKLALSFNPNIGWLNYNNEFKGKVKAGYSYGLLADLGFAHNYYFATGLLINAINSGVDVKGANDQMDRDISLKYLEVPLTVKLKSNENELGRFYGQFGFTAGVKVSAKEQLENQTTKTSIKGEDIFRLGLQIGGGAEWKLSNNLSLLTGLAYNNGFTRAINDAGKPKVSYLSLNVGLFF